LINLFKKSKTKEN